jgi:hypothetical protein
VDTAASDGDVAELAAQLADAGCDAIVVSLAHALTNGREQAMARTLRDRGVAATANKQTSVAPAKSSACPAARNVLPVVTTSSMTSTREGRRIGRARNLGPLSRSSRLRPV